MIRHQNFVLGPNITDIRNCFTGSIFSECEPLRAQTVFGECSEVALFQLRQGLLCTQVWLGLDVLNKDHFQWPHGDPIKPGCQQASLNITTSTVVSFAFHLPHYIEVSCKLMRAVRVPIYLIYREFAVIIW